MTKNERIEALKNAGINTSQYFSIQIPTDIKAGSVIDLIVTEPEEKDNRLSDIVNRMLMKNKTVKETIEVEPETVLGEYDEIEQSIIENGYVKNSKLHRRFIMAQMFNMLNHPEGYTGALKNYSYNYTLKTMFDEIHVLKALEESGDEETFNERKIFFTPKYITSILIDYAYKAKLHYPNREFEVVVETAIAIENATSYKTIERYVKGIKKYIYRMPVDTPKCKVWIERYKAEGAYYTIKNMIMYHNCKLINRNEMMPTQAVNEVLKFTKKACDDNEEYKVLGLLKFIIQYNDFNFNDRMEEIYNK